MELRKRREELYADYLLDLKLSTNAKHMKEFIKNRCRNESEKSFSESSSRPHNSKYSMSYSQIEQTASIQDFGDDVSLLLTSSEKKAEAESSGDDDLLQESLQRNSLQKGILPASQVCRLQIAPNEQDIDELNPPRLCTRQQFSKSPNTNFEMLENHDNDLNASLNQLSQSIESVQFKINLLNEINTCNSSFHSDGLWQEEDDTLNASPEKDVRTFYNKSKNEKFENLNVQQNAGFSFASGKSLTVNPKMIKLFQQIFEKDDPNIEQQNDVPCDNEFEPQTNETANISNVVVTNDCETAICKPSSPTDEINSSILKETSAKCSFLFASGKVPKISESKLNNFMMIFDEEDRHLVQNCAANTIESKPDLKASKSPPTSYTLNEMIDLIDGSNVEIPSPIINSAKSFQKSADKKMTKPLMTKHLLDVAHSQNNFRAYRKNKSKLSDGSFGVDESRESENGNECGRKSSTQFMFDTVEDSKILSPKSFSGARKTLFAPSFTSSPIPRALPGHKNKRFRRNDENIYADTVQMKNKRSSLRSSMSTIPLQVGKRDVCDNVITTPHKSLMKKPRFICESTISPIAGSSMLSPILKRKFAIQRNDSSLLSQRLSDLDNILLEQQQSPLRNLHLNFDTDNITVSQMNEILLDEKQHTLEIDHEILNGRQTELNNLIDYIDNKPSSDTRPMTGTLFMMKSCSNRLNLQQFVENVEPINKMLHDCDVTVAVDFKFNMRNFGDDEPNQRVFVNLADNAKTVYDKSSNVGFNEIKYAFLSSLGVDPKLVSGEWFENAYKMIFTKLIWMENSFEKIDKFTVLSPENMLLKLKYRYDREIDRHQRPALRKIIECDETPGRRIVLRVEHIFYSNVKGYELELSDGWYKILACVDSCIAEAIYRKKITVTTKLIISNMELLNVPAMGHDIFQLPHCVRLKIHGNSTRIAKWHLKLGFCKNPSPIIINSLKNLSTSGGVIGILRVVIIHVYSMIYVEANSDGKREFRSEKKQNRMENQKEILYSTVYEKVQYQIMQDVNEELKQRFGQINKNFVRTAELQTNEICDILEYDNGSDLAMVIKSQLTDPQLEKAYELHTQRKNEIHQRVKNKIKEFENSVSQVLKFRVVDAKNPSKTALISWWHPSEELIHIVKPRQFIELWRTTSAYSNGETQIYADNSSMVKLLKANQELNYSSAKLESFIRAETKLEDIKNCDFKPLNCELDVACIILRVDEKNEENRCQEVFIVDETFNLVSVNFYPNLVEYAYDDLLFEGNVLYIRNLKWRNSFRAGCKEIPEVFAVIDLTTFTKNSRNDIENQRLAELRQFLCSDNQYLTKCKEKLETLAGFNRNQNESHSHSSTSNIATTMTLDKSNRILGMRNKTTNKYEYS